MSKNLFDFVTAKSHRRTATISRVIGGVAAAGLAALFIRMIPEVVRYVKMERM